jgi:hypothetical protein
MGMAEKWISADFEEKPLFRPITGRLYLPWPNKPEFSDNLRSIYAKFTVEAGGTLVGCISGVVAG